MNGSRITVQFARGARHKENFSGPADRAAPRPRRTIYRMVIEGLAPETSWQDLKDFARDGAGVDVVYSETDRARDGKGFVEFETKEDLKAAVEKLDGRDYKGAPVVCRQDVSSYSWALASHSLIIFLDSRRASRFQSRLSSTLTTTSSRLSSSQRLRPPPTARLWVS